MTKAATTLEAVDTVAILKALPHRYPLLMVDRIVT
jgi:3-hydroxymyristoyl/3-hydroxydecanoyl-(acyl carrier protein) dehydratase